MKFLIVFTALVAISMGATDPYQALFAQIGNIITTIQDPTTNPAIVTQQQQLLHNMLIAHFPPNDPIAAAIANQVLSVPAVVSNPVAVVDLPIVELPEPVVIAPAPEPAVVVESPEAPVSSPLVQLIININSNNADSPSPVPSPVITPEVVVDPVPVSPAVILPGFITAPAAVPLPAILN